MSSSPAEVLQALMASATQDPDARNQALALLRKAPLWVCTWPTDAAQMRTLTNDVGVTVLPAFTDAAQLQDAALLYGWCGASGILPEKQATVAEIVRYARQADLAAIVLDVTADHAFELDVGDMELLAAEPVSGRKPASSRGLSAISGPTSSGPQGDVSSLAGPQTTKRTRRPSRDSHLLPNAIASEGRRDGTVTATFGGSHNAGLEALEEHVSDELTAALTEIVRGYPEVEWACLVLATRGGPGESAPAIGLRVRDDFRANLNEIIADLRSAGTRQGATLDVLVLDDPDLMRRARLKGTPFYPWKK